MSVTASIHVPVPRGLKRWLESAAREQDMSLAAYVRRILKAHWDSQVAKSLEATRHE